MRTKEDALNQFAYHPATPQVSKKYARLRNLVMDLTSFTWDDIPDGPEKTLAFRGLQQFLIHANLAIALTTPSDLETPGVARVLPGGVPTKFNAEHSNYDDLPDGSTWRCAKCGLPLNDNAAMNVIPTVIGYVCDACAVPQHA